MRFRVSHLLKLVSFDCAIHYSDNLFFLFFLLFYIGKRKYKKLGYHLSSVNIEHEFVNSQRVKVNLPKYKCRE